MGGLRMLELFESVAVPFVSALRLRTTGGSER